MQKLHLLFPGHHQSSTFKAKLVYFNVIFTWSNTHFNLLIIACKNCRTILSLFLQQPVSLQWSSLNYQVLFFSCRHLILYFTDNTTRILVLVLEHRSRLIERTDSDDADKSPYLYADCVFVWTAIFESVWHLEWLIDLAFQEVTSQELPRMHRGEVSIMHPRFILKC